MGMGDVSNFISKSIIIVRRLNLLTLGGWPRADNTEYQCLYIYIRVLEYRMLEILSLDLSMDIVTGFEADFSFGPQKIYAHRVG